MNDKEVFALGKQINSMDFKDIPAYIETLIMMGVNIMMVKAGTMKITFRIENEWFEIYSPTWITQHAHKYSKQVQAYFNKE